MPAAERAGGVAIRPGARRRRRRGVRAAPVGLPPGPAARLQRRRERALRRRARSGCSGTPTTRTTSSTRPPTRTCCTRRSRSASAAATASRRAFARDPGDVFAVGARARRPCSARSPSASWPGRARGCSTAASGSWPPRCSRSPSCPCTTPTSRSTTSRRWRPSASRWSASAGVYRSGGLGDYALAGAGLGLACATKYTGGIVLLPLLAATLVGPEQSRPAPGRGHRARGRARAGVLPDRQPVRAARLRLVPRRAQRAVGGVERRRRQARPDRRQRDPLLPRDDHLGPRLAAGPGRAGRRGRAGRARLAARAGARALDPRLHRSSWAPRTASSRAGCCRSTRCCACSPPTARSCSRLGHRARRPPRARRGRRPRPACCCARRGSCSRSTTTSCSRAPTRAQLARDWMVENVPAGSKVVIEPVVPDAWASDTGRALRATGNGARWRKWPTSRSRLQRRRHAAQGRARAGRQARGLRAHALPRPRPPVRARAATAPC